MEQEFFEAFNMSPVICTSHFYMSFIGSMDELIKSMPTCSEDWIRENYEQIDREITPEIVLKLMELVFDATLKKYPKTTGLNFDIKRDIKEQILSGCIQLQSEIQDQVRALFND